MMLPSPEPHPHTPKVVAVRVEMEEERREEAVELEKLRCARVTARMPRLRSTGHSMSMTAAVEMGDHKRFMV